MPMPLPIQSSKQKDEHMNIKKITVIGAGVLGAQIAYQAAYAGFEVISYDINEQALQQAKTRFDKLADTYQNGLADASAEKIANTQDNLTQSCNLAEAVANADLIIECVPESLELKQKAWAEVGKLAPKHTIFTTNTSTLLPSDFAQASGDESCFLALHFANDIWRQRVVEVMGTDKTNPEIVQTTFEFAQAMQMIPVIVQKEQRGYILNSLLVPFLNAACDLYANEVANPADVDKVWKLATGSPKGPFEILDVVGLRTVYAIHATKAEKTGDATTQKFAEMLKTEYLAKGKNGKESGSGFYDYDEKGNIIA